MGLKLVWRGSAWYVMGTLVDPTGEKVRVRKSTGFGKADRRFAEDERLRLTAEVVAGKWKTGGDVETLADAIRLFLNRPVPPGATDVGTLERLSVALGARKLAGLRGTEVMAWVTGRGNKPGTVAREIASIRACLGYARKLGVAVADVQLVKPSVDDGRDRWLTKEERDHLVACCPPEIRDLVLCLFHTGARLGEAFALVWADVVTEGPGACVTYRSRKGRGSKLKARQVPLRGEALARMRAMRELGVGQRDLVFVAPGGGQWDRSRFYGYWDKACGLAGVEDFRPHDCRHTFASLLVQAGVRERVVAQLLGHSTLSLVMRYSHLAPDHLSEALRALDSGDERVAAE